MQGNEKVNGKPKPDLHIKRSIFILFVELTKGRQEQNEGQQFFFSFLNLSNASKQSQTQK